MKTVIEVWHTDKDGWKSNHVAIKNLAVDTEGNPMPFDSWEIGDLSIYELDDIYAVRKLLDEIEKDISAASDK